MSDTLTREAFTEFCKNLEDSIEVCAWTEVLKLIKAFQDKYNDPGCNGLPYEPKTIKVELIATNPHQSSPK